MGKKVFRIGWAISGISMIMFVGAMVGCDRSEPPPPAQTTSPVAVPQPAQTQTAAPTPSGAPAAPPAQTQPAIPQTQATAPVMPSTQPAPAPVQPNVQQNLSQVQVGMTSQQVMQLLGNPTKIKQKQQELEWEYYTPQGKVEVEFQMDKVVKIETH